MKEYTLQFNDVPISDNVTNAVDQNFPFVDTLMEDKNQNFDLSDPFLAFISPDTDMRSLQLQDLKLSCFINYFENGEYPDDDKLQKQVKMEKDEYTMKDGILYHLFYPRRRKRESTDFYQQLVIPQSLKNDLLLSYHDSLTGGHQGFARTYEHIRQKYYWKQMYAEIQTFVETCSTCQRSKRHGTVKAPLHPLPIEQPFGRVHLDFLGPLKKTPEGFQHILLIVDSGSKWCEAFPTKTQEAAEVAKVFYKEIICRYGAPRSILTDKGQCFMAKLIQELCKIFQITKMTTSSYHPQTNATCERFNSFILQSLRAYCNRDQDIWPEILPSILLAYRSTPATESTQYSPYYLLFGREMCLPIDIALIPATKVSKSTDQHIKQILQAHKTAQDIAKENVQRAQQRYKQFYDKKAKEPNFQLDDQVWLYEPHTPSHLHYKMCQRYSGPYYIAKKFGNHTYKLRRYSDHKLLQKVFHANRLKLVKDPDVRTTNPPHVNNNPQHKTVPVELQLPLEQNNSKDKDKGTRKHPTKHQEEPGSTKSQMFRNEQVTNSEQKWLPVETIITSKPGKGFKWYRVKWLNRKGSDWVKEENISRALIREFHINKTMTGRKRKLPLRQT